MGPRGSAPSWQRVGQKMPLRYEDAHPHQFNDALYAFKTKHKSNPTSEVFIEFPGRQIELMRTLNFSHFVNSAAAPSPQA